MFKDSKVIGVLVFVLIGIITGITKPFAGLAPQGHFVLATVIIALGFWIFRPGGLPFMTGCAIVLGGGLVFGLKYDAVASGFASSALWTLIPALYFGFALQKTGLGKRIAYLVLKSFEPSWLSMAVSWFIIGIALSALTPSITVRIAIIMPIALSIVEACKLDYRSNGSAFITMIAWAMCVFPGTGWLTGSLTGPIMVGFLPAQLKPLATFDAWFQIMALPWLIITVIFTILIYFILKPKEVIVIPRNTFKAEYAALGAITREEMITLIVLVASLVLFATERLHHIPTAATALVALFVLIIFNIVTTAEISSGVNWDVIMFIGVAISLSTIFAASKVSSWIEPILRPSMLSLAVNPLTFLLVASFAFMLIRFIDVPWGFSTAALTMTVLIPIYNQFGIHPLVSTMVYTIGVNFFLLNYQQPFLLIAEGIMQNKGWTQNHVAFAGLSYIVAVVIALLVSIPYWRMISIIH